MRDWRATSKCHDTRDRFSFLIFDFTIFDDGRSKSTQLSPGRFGSGRESDRMEGVDAASVSAARQATRPTSTSQQPLGLYLLPSPKLPAVQVMHSSWPSPRPTRPRAQQAVPPLRPSRPPPPAPRCSWPCARLLSSPRPPAGQPPCLSPCLWAFRTSKLTEKGHSELPRSRVTWTVARACSAAPLHSHAGCRGGGGHGDGAG